MLQTVQYKVTFRKLRNLLAERNLSWYWLERHSGLSRTTIDRISGDCNTTTESIAAICGCLEVQPGDIMEILPRSTMEVVLNGKR